MNVPAALVVPPWFWIAGLNWVVWTVIVDPSRLCRLASTHATSVRANTDAVQVFVETMAAKLMSKFWLGGGRTIAIARYTQSERCKLGADDGGVGIDRESKRRCVWRSTNRAGYIRNTSRARNRESSIRGCLKCVLSTRRQPNPNSRVFYLVVTIYRHRTENFLCNSVQVHVYA